VFNKELRNKVVKLEKRIQGMSEIIHDFENNEFKVLTDELCTLVTNSTNKAPNSVAIEVNTGEVKNIMENEVFTGKEIRFTLKHPRTYR